MIRPLYFSERRARAVVRFLMLQVEEEKRSREEIISGRNRNPLPEFTDQQVDERIREIEEALVHRHN